VFATRGWARFALLCNLTGAVLLFLSFQATSSSVKILSSNRSGDLSIAVCINGRAIMGSFPDGRWFMGAGACSDNPALARSVAVVSVERPAFVTIGFILTTIGFLLQYLAVPSPKTIAQMRADIKTTKLKERKIKSGL
jgi:hypothetical protein